jgi:hypothetical protein
MDLSLHLKTLVLASVAAAASLVAIWVAESRVQWFWRALAVWACVAVMLPIRAYEPAMVFAVSLPLLVLIIRVTRWFDEPTAAGLLAIQSRAWPVRFSVRDVLLGTALLGLILAVALHVHRSLAVIDDWLRSKKATDIIVPATCMAVVAALSWYLLRGQRRWAAFVGLAVVIIGCAHYFPEHAEWLYALDIDRFGIMSTLPDRGELAYRVAVTGFAELASLIAFLVCCFGVDFRWQPIRGYAGYATLALLSLPIAAVYAQMLVFTPFPPGRVLSPSERRIIEIVQRMRAINEDSLPTNELEATDPLVAVEVRQLYAELLPLLKDAQALVDDLSRATIEQVRKQTDEEQLKTIRTIARALDAESKTAALEGDKERSAALAIASIRLGAAYCHDAILIGDLMGRVTTMYGYRNLAAIRTELNGQTVKRASTTLRWLEDAEEPPAKLVQRDMAYCERVYGWQCRLANIIGELAEGKPSSWNTFAAHIKGNNTWRAINRLFQADFAVRAFQNDHGQLPKALDELVPDYLPAPLLDPFTDRLLVYRTAGDTFVLYSVGKDGLDDGGNFANQRDYQSEYFNNQYRREHGRGFDLDINTLTRP